MTDLFQDGKSPEKKGSEPSTTHNPDGLRRSEEIEEDLLYWRTTESTVYLQLTTTISAELIRGVLCNGVTALFAPHMNYILYITLIILLSKCALSDQRLNHVE